jgi:RNA polymerase sigma factor (sigma-70 family)
MAKMPESSPTAALANRPEFRVPALAPEERVLEAVLPEARKIATFGYRIPEQEIDDILQQAAIDFLLHARRGARASAGLMVVITRRRCLDFWRMRYRSRSRHVGIDEVHEDHPAYLVCDADPAEACLDGARLARTWPSLSENCRDVLARRFWRNQKTADVAERLGYKPQTLKRMISRCLGRLRKNMGESE